MDEAQNEPVDRVADPELDVGRHLVVAAAAGVQLAADVAELLGQGRLDVHVDVFPLQHEREPPLLDLGLDLRQPPDDPLALVGRQQPDVRKHPRVRLRAQDVVTEQPLVEGDRLGELLHPTIRPGVEPPTPGLAGHRSSQEPPKSTRKVRLQFPTHAA